MHSGSRARHEPRAHNPATGALFMRLTRKDRLTAPYLYC
ncbi:MULTISPECIES: cittilin family RiPP precursor [unclassified Streptomyces]